jgi:hypothetical protein
MPSKKNRIASTPPTTATASTALQPGRVPGRRTPRTAAMPAKVAAAVVVITAVAALGVMWAGIRLPVRM